MRVLQTSSILRPAPIPYPLHSIGPTVETAAYQHLVKNQNNIKTDLIYLPIFWQSCYWADRKRKRTKDVGAVPEVQQFLDTQLDPKETYFSITQADEGAYENLPPNLIMFSGGGVGHIPVPLLCDDHVPQQLPRNILASFLGTIETGGPDINRLTHPHLPRPSRSSWNINGAGATVRRELHRSMAGYSDCVIMKSIGGRAGHDKFIELACSSKFALSPRGYGQTSFRMYEAMKLGAVPVYIYDDCWLPYADVLDWNDFAVLCRVDELHELHNKLSNVSTNQLTTYQQNLAEVIPDYFTMEGTCRQIVRYIEARV